MPSKRKTDDRGETLQARGTDDTPESKPSRPPTTGAEGGDEGSTAEGGAPAAEARAPAEGQGEAGPQEAQGPASPGEVAEATGETSVEKLTAQLQELSSQLEEANASRLRLAADFDNFKKRARQEQLDTMKFAAATVAERLLGVLDNADLALAHVPEGVDETWLKGIKLIFQRLEEVLAEVGVQRIESVGARFDPKLHEAIGSEPSGEYPEDTVVVELRPGYRMHERVLRPALVKVARPPA